MTKPVLRFPEFNDDWEEVMFGDLVTVHNENTSDKKNYPLYSLTIEDGVTPKTERYEREFLIRKEGDVYKIVPPNAFVYNPMNLRFGALKMNHESFAVSVSGYYDVFSIGDENTYKFWEYYLTTPKMLHYYFSIANGSLIEKLRVHFSQFVKIVKPIPIPKEQEKIATLFSSVDEVISAIESEVALWEEKKKGVMQKIFSQEVRFKKEDGSNYPEWEEKSFYDVFDLLKNNTFSRAELNYEKGKAKNIHYGDVLIKFPCLLDVEDISVPYVTNDEMAEKQMINALKDGDVIIADTAEDETVGKAIEVYNIGENKVLSGLHTIVIRAKKKRFSMGYLGYFINSELYHNQLRPLMQGIKVTSISKSVLSETIIYYPCIEEQKKIVDCLLTMDEVIKIKKQKLETWKTIKKGLLQQMFV